MNKSVVESLTEQAADEIRPMTMPGVHERFLPFLRGVLGQGSNPKVLDVGAGQGALSKRLHEECFDVSACDMFAEAFKYKPVEFRSADLNESLPYDDCSFDVLAAVEVTEHLSDLETFFRECGRVLKPGGWLVISTPNVLSLKSRVRFAFSGFAYSFGPLDASRNDGLQHISSLTLDQYAYHAARAGLEIEKIGADRMQRSSVGWLWLLPLMRLSCRLSKVQFSRHNTPVLLLGRLLFITFRRRTIQGG